MDDKQIREIAEHPFMYSPTSGEPVYAAWQLRAAYAAGMARAAEMVDERSSAAVPAWKIADAIRAEIPKGGKG